MPILTTFGLADYARNGKAEQWKMGERNFQVEKFFQVEMAV